MVLLHVGIDDVDSPRGGCTTHLSSLVVEKLDGRVEFLDYPRLIRLNPGVPWKTRGNGAVALTLNAEDPEFVIEVVEASLKEYVERFLNPQSQPVAVVLEGRVPEHVRLMGLRAVRDIIPLSFALKVAERAKARILPADPSRLRGVVGALSAIGVELEDCDYTYEVITYRREEYWGEPRRYNPESVKILDRLLFGEVFLNFDYEVEQPLIFPSGPDPVLYGVRGESPEAVAKALDIVEVYEPVDRWVIFRTNQATDMHLERKSISTVRPYQSVIVTGEVVGEPRVVRGGHVIFRVRDDTGEIDVAAYRPTGILALKCRKLRGGDLVEAAGVVRPPSSKHGLTLNLEKLRILKVATTYRHVNPKCPKCGSRMTSAGRGKGFKCRRCGFRDPKASKVKVPVDRDLREEVIVPPPRAFKHLMKPIEREGREKSRRPSSLISKWHHP